MRNRIRMLPWILALAGLAIPLIGTGFVVWPVVAVWLAVLGMVFLLSRGFSITRPQRIATAIVLLPILFLLAFEGGWWVIPADLTWLAIEVLDRGPEPTAPDTAG